MVFSVFYHFEPQRNGFDNSENGENDTMDKQVGGKPVTTNTDQIMEYIELDSWRCPGGGI